MACERNDQKVQRSERNLIIENFDETNEAQLVLLPTELFIQESSELLEPNKRVSNMCVVLRGKSKRTYWKASQRNDGSRFSSCTIGDGAAKSSSEP